MITHLEVLGVLFYSATLAVKDEEINLAFELLGKLGYLSLDDLN